MNYPCHSNTQFTSTFVTFPTRQIPRITTQKYAIAIISLRRVQIPSTHRLRPPNQCVSTLPVNELKEGNPCCENFRNHVIAQVADDDFSHTQIENGRASNLDAFHMKCAIRHVSTQSAGTHSSETYSILYFI